ncbi:hypothetical protein BDW59DRAFT_9310 [Aspergillus cavernicola]|uniref:Uncharacterized protein n=1 Tax=Aspergillus cavernicola TaxID=176166 RepID=A0ABR4HMD2_9EURO
MTSSPPAALVLETELKPLSSEQLGIGDSELVATSQLRKCTVSTIVRDVRRGYFVSGQDPSKQYEASVVVLQFEFGSQRRDSWQTWKSISHVTVKVSVDEVVDEDEQDDQNEEDDVDLLIAAHYPRSARGVDTSLSLTKGVTATLGPSANGFAVGSVSIGREMSYSASSAITLSSYSDGNMCRVWELNEDTTLKRGVPDAFDCAILLRTGGRRFELQVEFIAEFISPIMKMRRGGEVVVPIPERHLAERQNWTHGQARWEDFDSDEFANWVKEKTTNTWAETSNY